MRSRGGEHIIDCWYVFEHIIEGDDVEFFVCADCIRKRPGSNVAAARFCDLGDLEIGFDPDAVVPARDRLLEKPSVATAYF